jgi:hypothetical protein
MMSNNTYHHSMMSNDTYNHSMMSNKHIHGQTYTSLDAMREEMRLIKHHFGKDQC